MQNNRKNGKKHGNPKKNFLFNKNLEKAIEVVAI